MNKVFKLNPQINHEDSPKLPNEVDHKSLYTDLLTFSSENQGHWMQRSNKTGDLKNKEINADKVDVKLFESELEKLPSETQLRLKNELVGLGPLENLVSNVDIDEILVHGQSSISYELNGKLKTFEDLFLSNSSYQRIFEQITEGFFKSISYENPTGNGYWNGFRIHVIGPPIASEVQLSMRRIGGNKIKSLQELADRDFIRQDGLDLLYKAIDKKLNLLICGATSSGKTTLIQCLINECKNDRLLILEDSEELICPNSLSTSLICPTRKEQYSVQFSMKDLVKESLRMRPDRIVLGEARSDEAKDFIQALSTGHKGCISSIHALSCKDALTRLECLISQGASQWSTHVIRQLISTGVNLVVHVHKNQSGKREISSICEITSLEQNGFLLHEHYSSYTISKN